MQRLHKIKDCIYSLVQGCGISIGNRLDIPQPQTEHSLQCDEFVYSVYNALKWNKKVGHIHGKRKDRWQIC